MSAPPLILASTSPYRAELLGRLALPFETVAPEVDESHLRGEPPTAMVARLARAKAAAVAAARPDAVVLGGDQCLDLDGGILGKPGNFDTALAQLRAVSGRTAVFRSALCVLGPGGTAVGSEEVPFAVTFRALGEDEIRRYLAHDRPFDCAGSVRSEGRALALMERTDGPDPTALMGLPLIAASRLLRAAGLAVL
ncbi:MAG TPA: Maf family nucleotide pyrophosphatase [Gammaproteobacteria bacterium]|nr:Maf family nucleotide pyrophosphatase [Gammaproteobacteria bacterium]